MRKTAKSLKEVLRGNIEKAMQQRPGLETPPKLARRCYWPRGDRKGTLIGTRTISYLFDESAHSPNLDVVEAVGTALEVEPWQLFKDGEQPKTQPVAPLDVKMLAQAIAFIEEILATYDREWPPEIKAEAISVFYDDAIRRGGVDRRSVENMLSVMIKSAGI